MMAEITFFVREAEEGGYHARSLGPSIFAEGDTIDELKENIRRGIDCYYENAADAPKAIP